VLSAWHILEDRGLIEARPQSGYYVRGVLPAVSQLLVQRLAG
jgi:DNA-binding GntR family transcriptional regulator